MERSLELSLGTAVRCSVLDHCHMMTRLSLPHTSCSSQCLHSIPCFSFPSFLSFLFLFPSAASLMPYILLRFLFPPSFLPSFLFLSLFCYFFLAFGFISHVHPFFPSFSFLIYCSSNPAPSFFLSFFLSFCHLLFIPPFLPLLVSFLFPSFVLSFFFSFFLLIHSSLLTLSSSFIPIPLFFLSSLFFCFPSCVHSSYSLLLSFFSSFLQFLLFLP